MFIPAFSQHYFAIMSLFIVSHTQKAFHCLVLKALSSLCKMIHLCAIVHFVCVNVCVAAVEACVLHGLKRRAAGFLRSNKIAALFTKVGKSFPPAEELCRKAQELELVFESK